MIQRAIEPLITKRLFKGKAMLIFGPRQCGKSTMVENLLKSQPETPLYLNGDEFDVREMFKETTSVKLKSIAGKHKIIFIDEAQRIPDIGLTLKLFTDQLKTIQVIATGSSAFDLSGKVNEPLTGRKYEFMLYPLSFHEMVQHHGLLEEKRMLENRMLYGYYPEIVTNQGDETELLKLLADSYLYKDILMLEQVKKPVLLEKLLKALALQLGSEVNYHELGQMVEADKNTVEKYIDLLEKSFVVFRLPALNRNARNEIKKGKKIYFYDCGIRNTIINNFNPLGSRGDVGALWENFVISEKIKYLRYNPSNGSSGLFFWRTHEQQEIDLIEEKDGRLDAFELKWNKKATARFSKTFTTNYPGSTTAIITPANIEDFINKA